MAFEMPPPKIRHESTVEEVKPFETNEKLQKNRFQDQQYLFENWHLILNELEIPKSDNVSRQMREKNEKYQRGITFPFYYYKMKETVDTFVNILTAKEGIHEFLDIDSKMLSALVPKIRLFKITNYGQVGEEEVTEFSLFDNTDITSITEDNVGRGAGVGVESFTWDFQGSQPAEVEKNITAEMVMVFQTLEELFRIRPKGKSKYSYADLTFYNQKASQNKTPVTDCPIHEQSTKTSAAGKPFYIRAEVGWSLPNIDDEFFSTFGGDYESVKKLRKAIEDSTYVFLLQPVNHSMTIEQNGVAKLTLKFVAAIEDIINVSPKANILGTGEHDQERMEKLQERKELLNWAAANKNLIEMDDEAFVQEVFVKGINESPLDIRQSSKNALVTRRNRERLIEDGTVDMFKKLAKEVGTDNWSELTHKILSSGDTGQQAYGTLINNLVDSGNLYYMEINEKEIGQWREHLLNNEIPPDSNTNTGMPKVIQSLKEIVPSEYSESIKNLKLRDFEKVSSIKTDRRYRIIFMFYGDLIEAAMNIVDKRDSEKLLEKIGFILGPIYVKNSFNNKKTLRSIADIPISLEFFVEWFNKEVIRPSRTEFTLQKFIRSSAAGLIEGVLRSVEAGDKPSKKQRLGINTIHVPVDENGEDVFKEFLATKNYETTRTLDLEQYKKAISVTKHKKVRPFIVLYFAETPNFAERKPSFKKDMQKGVHHLYPGSDRGIVLNIDYEKTDIPNFYESQLLKVASGKGSESFVVDVFNCKMELIGNTIFKNGDLVYVEPSSMLGTFGETKTAAQRLGLLGYYRIVKVSSKIEFGNFTTDIECISEIAARGSCEDKEEASPYQKTSDVLPAITDKLISEK